MFLRTLFGRRGRQVRRGTERRQQARRLFFEGMEPRLMLAGDCQLDWLDPNMDEWVTPADGLFLVDDMNQNKAHPHNAFDYPAAWPDVNFDGWVTPIDALLIVNDLHVHGGAHPFVLECPPPVGGTATLAVTERSLGTSDIVVHNEQDVNFFRFESIAGADEDVFLTQVIVQADEGDITKAYDFTLWVDTDNDHDVDTILQSDVIGKGTTAEFDDIVGGGFTIPANEAYVFEVHADITGNRLGGTLSIGFADSMDDFLVAEEVDSGAPLVGISVNGTGTDNDQISVFTTTSKTFELKERGSLFITKDSVPTRHRQLLAGELGEPILRLELRAEDEAIDVTRLVFTDVVGAGLGVDNIDSLRLYRAGESASFVSATVNNCNNISLDLPDNSFCAVMESQQLVIPEDERVDVLVRPLMKSDEHGSVNGANGEIQLVFHKPNDFAIPSVSARGFESSNVLYINDGDALAEGEIFVGQSLPGTDQAIVGHPNDTVFARIVTIENVNPDANGTNVPQGTSKTIAEFKFTAATNVNTLNGRNKVNLDGIIFTVSSTNVELDLSKFDVYNKNDQTRQINCTTFGLGGGNYLVQVLASDNPAVDMSMDSGESITLVLEADILDNQVSSHWGSSLVVSLDSFSDRSRSVFGAGTTESHIRWSDSLGESDEAHYTWVEYGQTSISSTSYKI